MPTFVALMSWTEQGIREFRDAPKRADAFEELVGKRGGKLIGIYWTLGAYDLVAVIEAPDPETYTAIALELGSLGNVRTQSLRAFTRAEVEAIISKTA